MPDSRTHEDGIGLQTWALRALFAVFAVGAVLPGCADDREEPAPSAVTFALSPDDLNPSTPFPAGTRVRPWQGFFGGTTHMGDFTKYGLDLHAYLPVTVAGANTGGAPVLAVAHGQVERVVSNLNCNLACGSASEAPCNPWGNHVIVRHDNGVFSRYGHLQSNILVSRGDSVDRGQVLGFLGNSGNSGGPHLHFQFESPLSTPILFSGFVEADSPDWVNCRIDGEAAIDPNKAKCTDWYSETIPIQETSCGDCGQSQLACGGRVGENGGTAEGIRSFRWAYERVTCLGKSLGCPESGLNGGVQDFGNNVLAQTFFQDEEGCRIEGAGRINALMSSRAYQRGTCTCSAYEEGETNSSTQCLNNLNEPSDRSAYIVRGGFFGTYMCLGGVDDLPAGHVDAAKLLGAPQSDEFRCRGTETLACNEGVTRQYFQEGYMDFGCRPTNQASECPGADIPLATPYTGACTNGAPPAVFIHLYRHREELADAVAAANACDGLGIAVVCNPPIAEGPVVAPFVAVAGGYTAVDPGSQYTLQVSRMSFNSTFSVALVDRAGASTTIATGDTAEGTASVSWLVPFDQPSGQFWLVARDHPTGRTSEAVPVSIGTASVQLLPGDNPNIQTVCIDQGGSGFPPGANITLVFEDPTSGAASRDNVVQADSSGAFTWSFGLGAGCDTAARSRAQAYLSRVDPYDAGFTNRPARYWAEFWDGGLRTTAPVSYTLSSSGLCVPSCSTSSCGSDGCGGVCGTCTGTHVCESGACVTPGAPATTACGSISGATRWTLAMSPVLVTCDVTVTGSLAIDPGVIVQFEGASDDLIVAAGGTLIAEGTASAPIHFTSDSESTPSAWGGLALSGSAAAVTIRYAEFRYGGATSGVDFPILTNGTFQPTIEHVALVDNRRNAIGLAGGSYSANLRLNVVGIPYYLERSDLTVNQGVTMTVDPGVVLKFEDGTSGSDLIVKGRLVARGTAAEPIVFTSCRDDSVGGDSNGDGTTAPAVEDWGGIELGHDPSQAPSEISNASIRYAGEDYYGAGFPIVVTGRTQPTIFATTVSNSRRNAIGLATGNYSADLHLNVVGIPYYVEGDDITVNAGVTMTVDPGVVLKFQDGSSSRDLVVNGRLLANGTVSQPIVFTSFKDDASGGDSNADGTTPPAPEDWGGITLSHDPSQAASEITNARIRYAGEGSSGNGFAIHVSGYTQPTIDDVVIESSRRNAIGLATGAYTADFGLNVVGIPYYVEGADVTVGAGVTMTVAPGVVVKFQSSSSARDLIVNGRLLANGTADAPIIFTSHRDDATGGDSNADGTTPAAAEDWGGISLAHDPSLPPSEIRHARVRYAGRAYYGAGFPIFVAGTTQPKITDVVVGASRRNAIGLETGAYTADLRLNVVGIPYYVEGDDITVNAGVTMTVDPGVVIKFQSSSSGRDLTVNGRLLASGTEGRPIVFTSHKDDESGGDSNTDGSTAPAAGDWGGLTLGETSTGSTIEWATIAYAGEDYYGSGCGLRVNGASPLIESVIFRSNEDAVCVYANGQPDIGGGARGSAGNNRFEGHTPGSNNWAVYSESAQDIFARNNWWGSTSPGDINGIIHDQLDDASLGEVIYDDYHDCAPDAGCSDGDACTMDDACISGHCTGTTYVCDAPGYCETSTGAICNGDGTCTYPAAVGATCDDGDPCSHGDACSSSKTCAGTPYSCDSPPECGTLAGATCDGLGGCAYPPATEGAACGDAAITPCSQPDSCDEAGNCLANHAPTTDVCRASVGDCDVAEHCDGAGTCPADGFQPAGADCGDPSSTTCTAPDSCDGNGHCAPDHAAPTTTCRAAVDECDIAETCDGLGVCPEDGFKAAGVACGDPTENTCTAADTCDGQGQCKRNDTGADTVCREAADECDLTERCDGAGACPVDSFVAAGTACGDSADTLCTDPDTCDGEGACNANDAATTTLCRPAVGDCDVAEQCSDGACPDDAVRADGVSCRSSAGPCDVAEACDGESALCPDDRIHEADFVCRPAVGECDVAETCSGTSIACPEDGWASTEVVCRAASCVDGTASSAVHCTGNGSSCPAAAADPCAPYVCGLEACLEACTDDEDCGAEAYCALDGSCRSRAETGTPCTSDHECALAACVDGHCCDVACTGQCEACDVEGLAGTCSPVTGAPRGGRQACADDESGCGGTCDGSIRTGCTFPGPSVQCREPSCIDGVAVSAAQCQGEGTCPERATVSCASYRCANNACAGDCSEDADCAENAFCEAGVCLTKLPLGETCSRDDECSGGECIDGFCCDGGCAGQCEACDLAGLEGSCSSVTGAPHGGRPGCASNGTGCSGTCGGVTRDSCLYPEDELICREGSCSGATATPPATCDGAGACRDSLPLDCAPFTCRSGACIDSCVDAGDCADGYWCDAGKCVVGSDGADAGPDTAAPDTGPDETGRSRSNGGCRTADSTVPAGSGLLPLLVALLAVLLRRRSGMRRRS